MIGARGCAEGEAKKGRERVVNECERCSHEMDIFLRIFFSQTRETYMFEYAYGHASKPRAFSI